MTPHIGDAPDNQQRGIPLFTMADLRKIFTLASEDDLRAIAESLAQYTYSTLNARIQGDVRDDRKIRVTADGADVTDTFGGTDVKYPGESYADHLNFMSPLSVDVESDVRGR